jgi:hypothetical protein
MKQMAPLEHAHVALTIALAPAWKRLVAGEDLDHVAAVFTRALAAGRWRPDKGLARDVDSRSAASLQLSRDLEIVAQQHLQRALKTSELRTILPQTLRHAFDAIEGSIVQGALPAIRASAFLEKVGRALPEDHIAARVKASEVAKSLNDRLEKVLQSDTFWQHAIETAGVGGFLSLGKALGFGADYGAAGLAPEVRDIYRGASAPAGYAHHAAFLLSVVAGVMIANGLLAYMRTGKVPEPWDYVFPHGAAHAGAHGDKIGERLFHEFIVGPFEAFATRKAYWGDLWSEGASSPLYRQALQFAQHAFGTGQTSTFNALRHAARATLH